MYRVLLTNIEIYVYTSLPRELGKYCGYPHSQ